MATKQYYATGAFRYGTRMLQAGDPVELDAPNARLFTALGRISPTKPRGARAPVETAPRVEQPAAPKRKSARRKTKK